jgi:histidine decarboxylase
MSTPQWSLLNLDEPLRDDQIEECIAFLKDQFQRAAPNFAGYQVNLDFRYSDLAEFLDFSINNAGDPYIEGPNRLHTRPMERDVLAFCAKLFHVLERNYWGYVTNGSTESNLFAANLGRTFLEFSANADGSRATPQPLAYYSVATHYSIPKACALLRVNAQVIPTNARDQIDIPVLLETILRNDPVAHPPLIIANIGSTFRGAYDDVEEIVAQLDKHNIKQYYLHVDAALGGFFLPFLEEAETVRQRVPVFDFRLPIQSICVSGHKIIGAPFPCGVFLTLQENLTYSGRKQIEYIGSVDSTLSGSRNGFAALLLWYAIAQRGRQGLTTLARQMLEMSDYAVSVLAETGFHPQKCELGLAIVIDRPPEWVVQKWSLATQGEYAHIFTMGHVSKTMLNRLAADLKSVQQVYAHSLRPHERTRNLAQYLKNVPLFVSLTTAQLEIVANILSERNETNGVYLCREGDEGDEMYIIVEGQVEILRESSGISYLLYLATKGEAVGEMAVLSNRPRAAAMRTKGDVYLLVIQGDDFRTLMQQYPDIAMHIIQMLVEKLDIETRSFRLM